MIAPDDPRHGTPAGYVAGCSDVCCTVPRRRQRKAREVAVFNGAVLWRTHAEADTVMAPWLRMGLSRTAVYLAAGLSGDINRPQVTEATYQALTRVTEADFGGRTMVYSDLTKWRIYSLMAIGHPQQDMPMNPRGNWRDRDRINVDLARAIRTYYRAHEFEVGTSARTATLARARGYLVPLAWDDPGTLAWPHGTPSLRPDRPRAAAWSEIDHAVVERVLAGEKLPTTRAEKFEITARWKAMGRPVKPLNALQGWQHGRYDADDARHDDAMEAS
jgi:hypothetical protein